MHGYVYQSESRSTADMALMVAPNGSGKVRVHHYQGSADEKEAQSYAVATRTLMKEVEARLAAKCGMAMIEATLNEQCHGCTLPKSPS